jgi:hypothetical protein
MIRAVRLTWERAIAWRMRRHHLSERGSDPLAVVSDITGLHAQLMSSAELTLHARSEGLQPDAVSRALWEDRSLVKTWAVRGTLHLLPTEELPLWHGVMGTYRPYEKGAWKRAFGVTAPELQRLLDAVSAALDGRTLTRGELADEVARETGDEQLAERLRESWGAYLKPAAFQGRLCFGPNEGRQVTFTRPDTWAGVGEPLPAEEALPEITRRFLAAHGPATREDYGRWCAVSPAQAGKRIAALGDEVATVDIDGDAMFMLAADAEAAAALAPDDSIRLVPAFDQYVIAATKHAARLLPGDHAARIYRPQGWLSAVLLVGGRIEGVWRHERKGARIELELEPFRKPSAAVRRAAEAEAERVAAFLGGELDLRWL